MTTFLICDPDDPTPATRADVARELQVMVDAIGDALGQFRAEDVEPLKARIAALERQLKESKHGAARKNSHTRPGGVND